MGKTIGIVISATEKEYQERKVFEAKRAAVLEGDSQGNEIPILFCRPTEDGSVSFHNIDQVKILQSCAGEDLRIYLYVSAHGISDSSQTEANTNGTEVMGAFGLHPVVVLPEKFIDTLFFHLPQIKSFHCHLLCCKAAAEVYKGSPARITQNLQERVHLAAHRYTSRVEVIAHKLNVMSPLSTPDEQLRFTEDDTISANDKALIGLYKSGRLEQLVLRIGKYHSRYLELDPHKDTALLEALLKTAKETISLLPLSEQSRWHLQKQFITPTFVSELSATIQSTLDTVIARVTEQSHLMSVETSILTYADGNNLHYLDYVTQQSELPLFKFNANLYLEAVIEEISLEENDQASKILIRLQSIISMTKHPAGTADALKEELDSITEISHDLKEKFTSALAKISAEELKIGYLKATAIPTPSQPIPVRMSINEQPIRQHVATLENTYNRELEVIIAERRRWITEKITALKNPLGKLKMFVNKAFNEGITAAYQTHFQEYLARLDAHPTGSQLLAMDLNMAILLHNAPDSTGFNQISQRFQLASLPGNTRARDKFIALSNADCVEDFRRQYQVPGRNIILQ